MASPSEFAVVPNSVESMESESLSPGKATSSSHFTHTPLGSREREIALLRHSVDVIKSKTPSDITAQHALHFVYRILEEDEEVTVILACPQSSQQQVFARLKSSLSSLPDAPGGMVCAVTAHIFGDSLNNLNRFLNAVGCFCIALGFYEGEFRRVQPSLKEAMEKKMPTRELLVEAMDISNKHATCCCNMYFSFSQLGKFERAVEAAKRGLCLNPPLPTAIECMRRAASGYQKQERYIDAIQWWNKTMETAQVALDQYREEEDKLVQIQEAIAVAEQSVEFCIAQQEDLESSQQYQHAQDGALHEVRENLFKDG